MTILHFVAVVALAGLSPAGLALNQTVQSPQAGSRTYAQNYKDMVLATCIANAYKGDHHAANDAGSSVSALRDWTYYDMEKGPAAIKSLVDRYLGRSYFNPLVESEVKDVSFDFLKCLDLYHSKDLDHQVRQLVLHPNRTYREDKRREKP